VDHACIQNCSRHVHLSGVFVAKEVEYDKDANIDPQLHSSLLVLLRSGSSKTCTVLRSFFAHSEETHIYWAGSVFGLNNTAHAISGDKFWWKFWSRACTQHI